MAADIVPVPQLTCDDLLQPPVRPSLEHHWQALGAELGMHEGFFLVDTTDMPKQGTIRWA